MLEDPALAVRVSEELLDVLALVREGVDDASLTAKGAQRNQEMLAEQARIVERVVESIRKRADELLALQKELEEAGACDAAKSVGRLASDFSSAFATAAGPMRRWVLANEAGAESLKIAKAKINIAMNAVIEAADVMRLLSEVVRLEQPGGPTTAHQ